MNLLSVIDTFHIIYNVNKGMGFWYTPDCKAMSSIKIQRPTAFFQLCHQKSDVLQILLTLLRSQKILTLLVFWGFFQTPTPYRPPYNKYIITKINSKSIQPIIKLGTVYALRGLKRPQKTVVRLIFLGDKQKSSQKFSFGILYHFSHCSWGNRIAEGSELSNYISKCATQYT